MTSILLDFIHRVRKSYIILFCHISQMKNEPYYSDNLQIFLQIMQESQSLKYSDASCLWYRRCNGWKCTENNYLRKNS